MNSTNRVFAVAALVLALAASAGASVWTSPAIRDLGGPYELINTDVSGTHSGTGFVGLMNIELGDDFNVRAFGHFFGLSAGPVTPVATALQVLISDLKPTSQNTKTVINKATLSFDLRHGRNVPNTVSVTSFDTDGVLGFVWDPLPLASTVDDVAVGGAVSNSIDVTDLLQARVDQQEDWFGLFLKSDSGVLLTITDPAYFQTADTANVRLTVDYSEATISHNPEPSTLAIWSILGVALVAGRRRLFG